MAHKKAGGSTRQHANRPGKRLGLKVTSGEKVKIGTILIRQKGTQIKAGQGVGKGRDFTLFAIKAGVVKFKQQYGKTYACVV